MGISGDSMDRIHDLVLGCRLSASSVAEFQFQIPIWKIKIALVLAFMIFMSI